MKIKKMIQCTYKKNMAISNLDYQLQGDNLKITIADVVSRPNALNGRYARADFGLDFWANDYEIENFRWIKERADVADRKIAEAQSQGKDIDAPNVLADIANEVRENIKNGKKNGAFVNYLIYLIIPIIIVIIIFLL